VARRILELLREDGDDLGRPEKLVLEVHEPLSRAKRADVRLENRIVATPHSAIRPGGERANDLRLDVTRLLGNLWPREDLACRSVPAKTEGVPDVRAPRDTCH